MQINILIFLVSFLIILLLFLTYQINSLKLYVERSFNEILESEREERKDLMNRVMSRNLADYHINGNQSSPPKKGSTNFLKDATESALRSMSSESSFGGEG